MFFNEDHIRVYRPVTTDGRNPVIGKDGKPLQKIVHLPKSAKALLVKKNNLLPQHLQVKIEDVPFTYIAPSQSVDAEKEALQARVRELEEAAAKNNIAQFAAKQQQKTA